MIVLVIAILLMCLVAEFSNFMVFGKILPNHKVIEYLEKYEPFKLVPYSKSVISPDIVNGERNIERMFEVIKNGKFVSISPLPLFSKYYISEYGRVLRWSEGHYRIKEYFKYLKQNQEQ